MYLRIGIHRFYSQESKVSHCEYESLSPHRDSVGTALESLLWPACSPLPKLVQTQLRTKLPVKN